MDEEMYKWITDGRTSLFGFTLNSYLMSLEKIDRLLEAS